MTGVEQELRDAGLSDDGTAAVLALARPAVRLEPDAGAESPTGGTRIGGRPDLPAGTEWPQRTAFDDGDDVAAAYLAKNEDAGVWWRRSDAETQERIAQDHRVRARRVAAPGPLAFVAQVDLAEVAAAGPTLEDLPTDGRLLLFYDVLEMRWGFDPADRAGARLLYDGTPPAELVALEPPADLVELGDDGVLPEVPLTARPVTTLPQSEVAAVADALGGEDRSAYRDWWMRGLDEPAFDTHRVGGWPSQIQGDMTLQCAFVAAGHSTGDGTVYRDEAARSAAEREAPEWVLLLQVASDVDRGLMWGDSGSLFVWMRRDDLAARRFDRAHLVLQCF